MSVEGPRLRTEGRRRGIASTEPRSCERGRLAALLQAAVLLGLLQRSRARVSVEGLRVGGVSVNTMLLQRSRARVSVEGFPLQTSPPP